MFAGLQRWMCTHQSWTSISPPKNQSFLFFKYNNTKTRGVVVRECLVLFSTWYGSSAVQPLLPLYQQYDCYRAVAFCPNSTNLSANAHELLAHMPTRIAKNCAIAQTQREQDNDGRLMLLLHSQVVEQLITYSCVCVGSCVKSPVVPEKLSSIRPEVK